MVKQRKKNFFSGDLNIKVLYYESNKKVQHFFSSRFQYNMIPTINGTTGATRKTVTSIDHIITNSVISGIQRNFAPIDFGLITCEKSKPE